LWEPAAVWSVQVAPLSVEVQMSPNPTTAANFVRSAEDVMDAHEREPVADETEIVWL
jgi:hypothetical protein